MNVLLAVDESSGSEMALRAVLEQFSPSKTVVRVLNVLDWPAGLPPSASFAEGPAAADHVLALHDELRRHSRGIVDRAVHRLTAANFSATGDSREGAAGHTILAAAADWPADTIVLGSHGRRGVDRVLFGSVAEHILRHALCAVEVVRPALVGA